MTLRQLGINKRKTLEDTSKCLVDEGYRKALESSRHSCLPRLGERSVVPVRGHYLYCKLLDLQLCDLKAVLPKCHLNGEERWIDIAGCSVLAARVNDITDLKTPNLDRICDRGVVAYLRRQLAKIEDNDQTRKKLDELRDDLARKEDQAKEENDRRTKQFETLGIIDPRVRHSTVARNHV